MLPGPSAAKVEKVITHKHANANDTCVMFENILSILCRIATPAFVDAKGVALLLADVTKMLTKRVLKSFILRAKLKGV